MELNLLKELEEKLSESFDDIESIHDMIVDDFHIESLEEFFNEKMEEYADEFERKLRNYYTMCSHCNEYKDNDNVVFIQNTNEHICIDCLKELDIYNQCEECGEWYKHIYKTAFKSKDGSELSKVVCDCCIDKDVWEWNEDYAGYIEKVETLKPIEYLERELETNKYNMKSILEYMAKIIEENEREEKNEQNNY